MADLKITELDAVVTPVDTDLVPTVQGIGTTPLTKKATWATIKAFLFGSPTFTGTVILPESTQIQGGIGYNYTFASSDITTNRQTQLPLLTGNDTFVFEAHTQTLTNKTIDYNSNTITNLPTGSALWTAITGTRASNTTVTVATDLTAIFKKGMIVRWQESGVDKVGMVSIPSTYGSPNTTITIIGDTCASIDASSFKYSSIIGAEQFYERFAVAGNIGGTGSDIANAFYAHEPMRVLGADLQVGTVGSTNSTTIDINKNGTTMFTTKPTLATTVVASPTPFTSDSATSLALNDRVSIDIDAIQTTNAIDLYVKLYLIPTRYLNLV